MALVIDSDVGRFRQIVRGRVREELRRFMQKGELIGRKGKNLVSIPLHRIDLPRFVHHPGGGHQVGQGDGELGQAVAPGDGDGAKGQAGNAPGEHLLEVEMTIEELAALLGSEFGLPRIEPKGRKQLNVQAGKYSGIATAGPESLRHVKRTFRQALKRQLAAGIYDPDTPRIIPIREDKRYRSSRRVEQQRANAVIIYVMDVSGSMGEEQKEIVRITSFWLDTWIRAHYKGLETIYVVHDAEAREVDRDTFFRLRESGGTVISSAYRLCQKLIAERYPADDWNLYLFQFSDGDNWSQGDTETCLGLLREGLLPNLNLFAYGQVESPYGSGQFLRDLQQPFAADERVVLSVIDGKEAIPRAIREFLSTGR